MRLSFVLSLLLVIGPGANSQPAEVYPVTIEDVLDAIAARRSRITKLEIKYSCCRTYTEHYFQAAESTDAIKQQLGLMEEPSISERPPKESTEHYLLTFAGDSIAYSLLRHDGVVMERASLEDGIVRWLDPHRGQALIEPHDGQEFLAFPVISTALGSGVATPDQLLESEDASARVMDVRETEDSVLIDVRVTAEGSDSDQVNSETLMSFDVVNDFWLVSAEFYLLVDGSRVLTRSVNVTEFHEQGKFVYPKEFVVNEYMQAAEVSDDGRLSWSESKLGLTETFTVSKVHFGEEVSSDHFEIEFPEGCIVTDQIKGQRFLVDRTGALEELSLAMGTPILDPDDYSWDEAKEILQNHRRQRSMSAASESEDSNRSLLLAINCILILAAATYFFLTRRR